MSTAEHRIRAAVDWPPPRQDPYADLLLLKAGAREKFP